MKTDSTFPLVQWQKAINTKKDLVTPFATFVFQSFLVQPPVFLCHHHSQRPRERPFGLWRTKKAAQSFCSHFHPSPCAQEWGCTPEPEPWAGDDVLENFLDFYSLLQIFSHIWIRTVLKFNHPVLCILTLSCVAVPSLPCAFFIHACS